MNIAIIMSHIDPQTRKFTEPPEQVREEIAALKADKSVSDPEKKEGLRSSKRRSRAQSPFRPSLFNDIFCKCVTRLFGLMVRVKMNATVLEALPRVIERGSQNANGVRVKDLCRVRNRVSVEILFHVASPSQGAQVVYRSRLRELPRALCT